MVDLPFPVNVTVILVFSVMLLFSLVGNALIIIMVFKRPELKNTTNFFIVNMAVCAIVLTLTSTPVRIEEITIGSYQWNIGIKAALIFCKLSVFVERLTIAVSVESLCWIALDRFLAVVFPMKVHAISSRCRALAITCTWIIGLALKSLDLSTVEIKITADGPTCRKRIDTIAFSLYAACFQIAPLILMTILYCVIAWTLQRQNKALGSLFGGSLSNEGPCYLVKMSRPSYHLHMDHRTRIKVIRPVYGRNNNHCRWTYVHKTYRHYCVFVVCSLFSNCTTYPHDNPILCFIKNWIIV